ncbi:MAG: exodeoxyribonuclease III [Candidatus Thiodiazotropha sp. (ex Myrtea spinifera)]|nr:exodeoxyribonuclease III [Candidatus Thiodiazotropha sp. (ex Myrtea spinifera)]
MKVVSFNTNGIRAREHQLSQLKETYDPQIIGIQESKVQDADFPLDMIGSLGYTARFHGQKTHYGVALLSTLEPEQVSMGFSDDGEEAQRRLITARYTSPKGTPLTVINGYFPQGESRDHEMKFPAKRKFYADLLDKLKTEHDPSEPLLVIGDMNVAPHDIDIGIGEDNAKRWLRTGKCSFLPEEREWLQAIMDWGLQDCYRELKPEVDDRFSWFDYRSRGFDREPKRGLRIDLMLATAPLIASCRDVGIAYDIRGMEKPSDHCPIWAEFDF